MSISSRFFAILVSMESTGGKCSGLYLGFKGKSWIQIAKTSTDCFSAMPLRTIDLADTLEERWQFSGWRDWPMTLLHNNDDHQVENVTFQTITKLGWGILYFPHPLPSHNHFK